MSSAIGIVRPTVTTPHGLSPSAFTTTSASTAISTIMMPSTAISAVNPATGPISSFAICPSDFPFRRTRRRENHEILHGAAERDADENPDHPGQESELRRERWSDEWSRSGDRREVMAEHDPPIRRDVVAAIVQSLGRRLPIRDRARRSSTR